jgi:hypothetical protein
VGIGVDASIRGKLSLGDQATNTLSVGGEVTDGVFTPLHDDDLDGKMTSEPRGDKTATGELKLYAAPEFGLFIDSFPGPEIGLQGGVRGSAEQPCPGKVKIGPYLAGTIGGSANIFGHQLGQWGALLPELDLILYSAPFFGCGTLTISTDSLPDVLRGEAVSRQLEAANGTGPYTWTAAAGLPPGLSLGADGLLSGRPSAARSYAIKVTVKDATGATADGIVHLDVLPMVPVPLSVATSRRTTVSPASATRRPSAR